MNGTRRRGTAQTIHHLTADASPEPWRSTNVSRRFADREPGGGGLGERDAVERVAGEEDPGLPHQLGFDAAHAIAMPQLVLGNRLRPPVDVHEPRRRVDREQAAQLVERQLDQRVGIDRSHLGIDRAPVHRAH